MADLTVKFFIILLCSIFGNEILTIFGQQVSYQYYSASDLELRRGQYINIRRGSRCKPITSLDLCECRGSVDVTTFSRLTDLRIVNITGSQIHYLSCDTFSSLRRLEVVSFQNSTVRVPITTDLPNRLPLPFFEELSFQNSNVSGLTRRALYDLSSLRTLSFDSSNVTNISPNIFDNLTSITQLSIRSSRIESFDFSLISNLNTLQYLALYNVQTSSQIDYSVFTSLPNLQTVLFDSYVYTQLDFESFSSLQSVEIVRDDRNQTTIATFNSAIQYLRKRRIQYRIIDRV